MRKEEKEILRKLVVRGGLLSPVDFENGIAEGDRRSVHNLVARGYVAEVPTEIHTGSVLNFYRASEKGLNVFDPWYKRFFFFLQGDLRAVIISAVTAFVTIVLTYLIAQYAPFLVTKTGYT